MNFTRVRLSTDITQKLKTLKMRTGLTPNIMCRFALCYSLTDPSLPDLTKYDADGQELNRFTLLGEGDTLYVALVKERIVKDGLDLQDDFFPQFVAHMNRGVEQIYSRVKCIADLDNLLHQ